MLLSGLSALQRTLPSSSVRTVRFALKLQARNILMAVDAEKDKVRKAVKAALRGMTKPLMQEESDQVAGKVVESNAFKTSKRLGIYLHCAQLREVDTSNILQAVLQADAAKRAYVPIIQDQKACMKLLHLDALNGLHPVPPFNILEPHEQYEDGTPREDVLQMDAPLDLIVMPGLAFDTLGNRLGRGGGYYDSYISQCITRAEEKGWEPPLLVALAYSAQITDNIPMAPHDKVVDVIVTARDVYKCTPRAQEW